MITNRKELEFYLKADMMMNRGYFKKPLSRLLYELIIPDDVMKYLRAMRKFCYYSFLSTGGGMFRKLFYFPIQLFYKRRFTLLGYKLGFSIGADCFGYGLVFHHHGSIIVGPSNRIGNYALLNTSTCIVDRGTRIGNGLFMGSGAVLSKKIILGSNVLVGANAVVNKSFPEGKVLIAGIPATIIKNIDGPWYESLYRDFWKKRHDEVENLKEKMRISIIDEN